MLFSLALSEKSNFERILACSKKFLDLSAFLTSMRRLHLVTRVSTDRIPRTDYGMIRGA
jgi:hypothetical protein